MKELICIECPRGCHLLVDEKINVTGNSCIRGKTYAVNELTCPQRIVTTTVMIDSIMVSRLPVMTEKEVSKDKMFEIMAALNDIKVKVPIKCRDIVVKNICNTGVNVIATRTIEK